jgi:hypothetical protein
MDGFEVSQKVELDGNRALGGAVALLLERALAGFILCAYVLLVPTADVRPQFVAHVNGYEAESVINRTMAVNMCTVQG